MKKLYEADAEPAAIEVNHAQVIGTETAQRQRSAASLASGEGDDAEYLENAQRAAWQAVEGDAKFITLAVEGGENPYPEGWPPKLPKHVVVNRYVQLSDDRRSLASWDHVKEGHWIAVPGNPVGRPVPLEPEKAKATVTFLHRLAERRGVKVDD